MLSRLALIQLLSPAFPTGGFAYSHGLEQAISDGLDVNALGDWIGLILEKGGGWTDAVLLSLALRGGDADELSELARAIAGSLERLTETLDQGRAFSATVSAMGTAVAACPLPVAVGVAARRLDLPPADVVAHYLHGFCWNLIYAAMRLLPIGQAQGQAMLADLHPLIAATAERAAIAEQDALETACIGAELAAMRHETLKVRIFRT